MAPALTVPQVNDTAIAYVNGKRYVLPKERGDATLLQWLREIGLTGTKLGCGEGGCGACTVMLSHWEGDREHGHVVHRSANACLCPLYAVEGMHVVTVEGIGNLWSGMHPVQSQLANSHGSQCGFCTPGFVMSMYSLLRSSEEPPTEEDIEDALGGNLCRCTGYRPILDAFKTFAKTDPKAYTEEAIAAAKGVIPSAATNGALPANGAAANGSHANGNCANGSHANGSHANGAHANGTANGTPNGSAANGCGANGCSTNGCGANGCAPKEAAPAPAAKICPGSGLPCDCGSSKAGKGPSTTHEVFVMGGGVKQDGKSLGPQPGTAEPIFPPELKGRVPTELCMPGPRLTWHRPTSLARLLQLKAEHPYAKLVVGNTEVGIEMKFKAAQYPVVVSPAAVPELNQLEATDKGVEIGAAVTLTNLMKYFKHLIATRPAHETSSCCAVVNQLRWFAGNQIRNVSALGGNIVTGSPISDLNPVWMASERGCRDVPAANFFLGYRTVDMKPDEILLKVTLPFTRKYEYVKEFKQAPRREDDIAIVNAGMRIRMEQDNQTGGWVVAEAAMAYGGVAAKAVRADQTCAALVGKSLDQGTLGECLRLVQKDVAISDNAPGGRVEYRRALVASFLFKFFVHVANMLEADSQVSGEAGYTDDIKLSSDALVAVLVTSSKPHARLTHVDASKALEVPGVVAYYGSKDVPGLNRIGPVVQDEEVFATECVTAVGQPIGIIVAENEGAARHAARLMDVGYEDLPAVMSCEEAYEAGSYYNYSPKIESGDPEGAMEKADHVIEGTFKVGGQEHFYLEPQNCCVIPHENDELTLYSSTQIVSKTKRVGGGFGGKETRSIYMHCCAAVPAHHLRRPVRLCLDRDEDMQSTGHRHAFMCRYKVGFGKDGRVSALDAKRYSNVGNSMAGALVHVYLDGTVLVTHGGVEMGQGLHTKMAQVAAQALGTPLSKVFISETSTDKVPNSSPTAASASSDMYGGAILDACKQINARLQPIKDKKPGAAWKDIVNAAYLERIDLSAHGFYATPDITGFGGNRPFNYFCFVNIVMDVGNPINPAIDIGQVEGGFVQGMGWLCLEELQWGDKQHPWVRPGHLQTKVYNFCSATVVYSTATELDRCTCVKPENQTSFNFL
ncbi:molybdopterin binding aldehyde oxidase/xanthine dehydrogenase [Dunaliella salina]|uniref:Molybdopterin binding aldehyde oxidase/xanthine dehydrogenase n=1 Tax=Dunaliella salina TaxID=3046 RepID=A0ABQ7GW33_DUNSA|nr:molybdopterin binding aldehyde oxidase/xanthine dehydrogenase [Dunaliella salina]|eukprot:KAF5838823.1 molybdopterin binding aldehyde oxidase/xanthine dehydrogenase [Dunaliella salina]